MKRDAAALTWPSEGLERILSCPVCGSDRRSSAYRGLADNTFFCAPGSWEMHRCEQCGSYYLDPRPTAESNHLAYARYFTHGGGSDVLRDEQRSGLGKLRQSCANGYRNWRYGTQDRPAATLGIWLALLLPPLRRIADAGMRFVPRVSSGRRLLDVGAGNGAYLLRIRSAGWDVLGVEPDPAAASEACRAGLDVRQGGIHCLAHERNSIDVITMNHVIEHVHEPRTVLREALALLRPGGVLYLETPNIESFGHKRFGRYWRGLEPPRHLVLFTWDSLECLLKEVGFGAIRRLPRFGVYATHAAKSRAIERGVGPETIRKPAVMPALLDTLREMRTIFDYRGCEFITLLAVKR